MRACVGIGSYYPGCGADEHLDRRPRVDRRCTAGRRRQPRRVSRLAEPRPRRFQGHSRCHGASHRIGQCHGRIHRQRPPGSARPVSQLHIARDGTVTVVAAGAARHRMRQQRHQPDCTAPDELARRAVFRPGEQLRGHQSSAGPDFRPHDRTQGVRRSRTREVGSRRHRHGHLARRHPGPHRCGSRYCAYAATTRPRRSVSRCPALPRFRRAAGRCAPAAAWRDGRRRLRPGDRSRGASVSAPHARIEGGRHRRPVDRGGVAATSVAAERGTPHGRRRGVVSRGQPR